MTKKALEVALKCFFSEWCPEPESNRHILSDDGF